MPGTTRYSATFDRTYEEDDRLGPPPPANARRSRSQSLQTLTGLDGRPYTPLGPRPPAQRSSSTDSGAKGPDFIPTRTVAKTTVKAHNNPFQFVKVGSCPLYKKAEEQLQKTKEVKKQDVFREEEEEWQSNLDSWKSRRRKMSEDVFRRQEEIKQFELEEQFAQVSQKKTKTFSEMVESRAHRGRALSLCLISNPLEFQDWEFENKSNTNGSCSTFTDESEENSNVNSEDEGFSLRGRSGRPAHHDNQKNIRTNGDAHIEQNGSKLETQNGDFNNVQIKPKEGSYIDSGLESISSSHRAGDTPDSGSDFSQDSNSSIDCESPRTGVNILEEFSSKTLQMSGEEISVKLSLSDKTQGFGFQFQGGKDAGQVLITSVAKECSGVQIGDQIMRIEGSDVSSKTHAEIISLVQKGQEKGEISLILWRHTKTTNGFNTDKKCVESPLKPNTKDNQDSKSESQQYEKSIESENEMYVDDFEELQRQSELLTSSKASETTCTNSQAQSGGKISTVLSSDKDSVKSALVPKIVEHVSNGAVDKENTNEKTDSEISTESPKKNIVKVKRVRRKGVYALDVSGTPNSIPQEGIPVGALYPLSPVTELPSPADETKTISSTLSSKPTTPVSNSQSSILPKETEAKVNSSAIKENNKTTVSAPKSVISKTTAPSDESKINVSEKVESKIDSSNVPSSPTVTKNKEISLESSVEEKPKLPSSPKKVKVKVKKANAPSEQKPSESSLSIKETSVSQISDLSVKKLTSESQPKKEQKSDSVTDDKSVNVNKNENVKPSSKMENNVSSTETATTKSDAISSSSNDKTSCIKAETSPKNPRNLSLKINTPNESANLAATPPVISAKTPKTPVDEKSKPPLVPKKDKVKPKESSAGSTPVTSEEKSVSLKDKSTVIVNNASVEKTKNISVKTDTKDESLHITTSSPVTSSKLPKTPQEEKAKPSLTQTKEKTKSKEVNTLPFESAVNTKEVKPIELTDKSPVTSAGKNRKVALDNDTQTQATSLPSTPPVQDIKMPKSPQDEKPKASLAQKKDKIPKENNSLAVESDINMKEAKSTELKDKSLDTSDKNKKPTSVDAQNQATNLTSTNSIQDVKMPKTPQEEKPKSTVAQKKEKLPKENTTLPVESAMSTKEVKSVELKDKIPVTSVDKNKKPTIENDTKNQPTNSALTPSAQDAKKPKTPQDEKPKAPLAQKKDKVLKENNSPITETSVNVQDVKSSSLKEKTAVTTNESSPNKTRDLSLNIQVQDPAANLATSPVPSNAKQPKTPQSDKSKPSFVQKKGKSKAKTPDKSPDSSQETKETFIISITTTSSPAVNFTQENPLIKELNSLSAETKENSSCSEGNTIVIQETKGIDSMNTTSACSSVAPSTKTKKLSLNIQAAQNQSINEATPPVVTAKPPKTPQDEKSKLSFSQKKGKSKAKGKMADLPTTPPTQTSPTSQSLPSSPKTVVAESDQKVQKSGSLTDVTSVKVLNENNKLLPRTPTIPSEIKSTDSKEKLNSDKTKNLSLQVDTQKESVASDAVSSDRNTKEPKTPQEEKTKPRLVRRKSKSKGKAAECMSPASPVSEKESSNNLSCKPAETVKPKSDSHTKQNSSSIANDVQVSVSNERAKSSETRGNNTLSSGTSTETKTFSSEKSISSDENKKFSLDDAQKVSVPLEATPSVANNKQPKTPQDEKTKPRLVRKRSKSKGKITEPTSPGSTVSDKGTAGNSLPHTTGESSATRNEPHEQNLGLVTNDVPGALLNESTESSNAREKNSLLNGTPTALPEPNETKEKSAAAKNTKNLSLKIEAQNDSVALDTAPVAGNNTKPKTPQGDKAKPRLARKRSKSKGKNTEQLSGHPSQVDKNSLDNSASQTSATETLASSKEPQKEQKLVSVADDKPIKMVNEKAESSDKREKNDLSSVTPTTIPKATSISLKENLGITSSDKIENLSLNINLNEPATTDKKPAVAKSKQPRTPQDEKPKPHFIRRRERSKSRDKFLERYPSCDSFDVPKEEASSSPSLVIPNEKSTNKMQPKKKQNGASDVAVNKLINTESSQTMDNSSCAETADVKSTASKDKMSVGNIAMDSDKTRNLTEKCKQPTNTTVIHPVVNTYPSQTDEKSKASLVQNKEITKPKEKASLLLETSAVCANIDKNESQKSPSTSVSSCNVVNANPSVEKNECVISSGASTKSDFMQSSINTQENKSQPVTPKKTKTKKKNTNSQKVNSPAKQNEELTNLNIDSLNVIFQSESKNSISENHSFNNKNSENNSNKKAAKDLVPDIPPVEKVAEEMEKLILEQLEEEERAKELASQTKNSVGSPDHLLTAPPRLAEPPKEKPPPPPSASEGSQKDSSLKRVNSTKRIKKEIHKRRSNFLGIDNADESIACSEASIPPPPALEEILKAEMELDRQSRLKIESAAIERLTLEEKEIMQKEREIIESLECEERQKQLLNGTEDFKNVLPTATSDVYEDDRILSLKNERKRIETERFITEEQQQLNLLEEKQLREREEFIRKQEAGKSAGSHSDSSLSVAANAPNNSKPAISSLTETKPKVSLSGSGDGGNSSAGVSENKSSESDGKNKTSEKPAVPPKPLKKKEAIRKERERLRQEQEALQREREEHRRKLMLEQEELMKQQKSHAPDAPVSQLGPLPPLVSPNFPPQLTTTMNATPNARESASFPSRSHHGASNGTAGSINAVELMGPPTVRQNKLPAPRKAVQNEAWGQQKMPSVRKQNHDSLTESRYNQNHWLIQEAEMRRISELKERQQRTSQLPCSQTHLAEDDVCSNSPRVPVITPTPNPHLNYAVQEKMWNYGQSNMAPKKYPPPVVKEPLHTVYPRETVSQQPPTKPSRVVPMERQEQMLSVSGRKRCSHCNEELGRGAAMIIESLQLYYHIHCFQCCVCQAQLGNGSCGTDVRVRNNKLHCHNCYSNDEAGLKFSQV